MRVMVAGVMLLLGCGFAAAAEDGACLVAQHIVHADFGLPHAAAAIARKQLNVVVVGTGSSALGNAAGAVKAYPSRLEDALTERLPGVAVKVTARVRARETAAEMEKGLGKIVADDKPDLVIWQTGTVDAMMGVDAETFRRALDAGVGTLHDGKADVVFMNMQYSPRTDSMIALSTCADALRLIAIQREVPLFDRLAIMKYWNEAGTFDLATRTRKTDTAERVHKCLGTLLAGLIVDGVKLAFHQTPPAAKDLH